MTRLDEIRERLKKELLVESTPNDWDHRAKMGIEPPPYQYEIGFLRNASSDIAYLLARIEKLEKALQWYAQKGSEDSEWSKAKMHTTAERALAEDSELDENGNMKKEILDSYEKALEEFWKKAMALVSKDSESEK